MHRGVARRKVAGARNEEEVEMRYFCRNLFLF